MKYRTALFDLDGTLLNTLKDLSDSVNHVLKEFSYPPVPEIKIRSYLGNGIKRLLALSLPNDVSEAELDKVYAAFMPYYIAHCGDFTKPYDGIEYTLKILKERGIKMAIVSNKNHVACEELKNKYFSRFIDVAIGENESAGIRKKPAPDTVNEALRRLNAEKSSSVYIGDSEVDKTTADNAGIDCISVSWGFRDKELLDTLGSKALIDKAEDLLEFF